MAAIPDPEALGLHRRVVDPAARDRAVERCRARGDRAADVRRAGRRRPRSRSAVRTGLADADPQGPDARNLFRVHWHNVAADPAAVADLPEHVVLPSTFTGVDARIVVAFGNRFPMIGAHKVLAAYSCLAPRVVSGQFDPTVHRAVWPSTGNYARGGVAISRIMGCRGVAVLPENMSRERFEWLDRWVADPADVIRTPGSESNVKEIYDECRRLAADPDELHPEPVLRAVEPPRPLQRDRAGARVAVPGARATASRSCASRCSWRRRDRRGPWRRATS